ncbi:MAG: hypothetical protein HZC28_04260 [Spirochaetes bacterium]|nr:hypothetical protein [Spirochaetota bacterium]
MKHSRICFISLCIAALMTSCVMVRPPAEIEQTGVGYRGAWPLHDLLGKGLAAFAQANGGRKISALASCYDAGGTFKIPDNLAPYVAVEKTSVYYDNVKNSVITSSVLTMSGFEGRTFEHIEFLSAGALIEGIVGHRIRKDAGNFAPHFARDAAIAAAPFGASAVIASNVIGIEGERVIVEFFAEPFITRQRRIAVTMNALGDAKYGAEFREALLRYLRESNMEIIPAAGKGDYRVEAEWLGTRTQTNENNAVRHRANGTVQIYADTLLTTKNFAAYGTNTDVSAAERSAVLGASSNAGAAAVREILHYELFNRRR